MTKFVLIIALALTSIACSNAKEDCKKGIATACIEACAHGVTGKDGCLAAASMLEAGDGIPKNKVRAGILYAEACNRGQVEGCYKASTVPSDWQHHTDMLSKGCRLNSAACCDAIARDFPPFDHDQLAERREHDLYAAKACRIREIPLDRCDLYANASK